MAQDLYPAKFPNGKLGYINSKCDSVISSSFDEAHNYYDGYAFVEKDNKFGIIDSKGQSVVDFIYDDIDNWELFEGKDYKLFPARIGYLWGVINYNGEVFLKPSYKKDSDDLRNAMYYGMDEQTSNYTAFENTWRRLKVVVYDSLVLKYHDINDIKERKYGKVSLVSNRKTDFEYIVDNEIVKLDFREGINDSRIKCIANDKWGFLNSENDEWAIRPIYDEIHSFSNGFAGVKFGGKWKYIDVDGKELSTHSFDKVGNFDYSGELNPPINLAVVVRNDSILYLTSEGEIIAPTEGSNRYEYIQKYLSDDFGKMLLKKIMD